MHFLQNIYIILPYKRTIQYLSAVQLITVYISVTILRMLELHVKLVSINECEETLSKEVKDGQREREKVVERN